MIVTELRAAYALWVDQLFVYDVFRRAVDRMERGHNTIRQFAIHNMKLLCDEIGSDLFKLTNHEAVLLGKREVFEQFLRTGNSRLSSLASKSQLACDGFRDAGAFLTEWNACSRRVFQLGPETQRLLENTDHQELGLDDIIVPFSNFVVRFAQPLTLGKVSFGAVGFSETIFAEEVSHEEPAWSFFFLPTHYEPIPEQEKKRILKDLEKSKRMARVFGEMTKMLMSLSSNMHLIQSCFAPIKGIAIPQIELHSDAREEALQLAKKVHAIVVNLMAVTNRLGQRGSGNTTFTTGGHESVISTENVFDLSGMSMLDGIIECKGGISSNEMFNNSMRRITPHWRRKHLRRRPGMGHLPDAPRDVKVPATLVLGDFLKIGTLPVGTVTRI